ncbi:MAG: ACT domain-containing protein, partial [Candidatus Electrothrix sp. AUS1_2]|nr:ACT domain-containing protein [Candidatus Electrothrix sp. AUS1_2]
NVLFYGQGAGKLPTGSAVAADVMDIARDIAAGSVGRVPSLSYLPENIRDREVTPLDKLACPYYFRITALDQPGVLAAVSAVLSKHRISIESVIQKGREENEPVAIVMQTHTATEEAVAAALAEIDALEAVTAPTVKIRMLED